MDKAIETQLNNIQVKTGKSLDELSLVVQQSGLTKHAEIRQMLMDQFGLGHGDANTLVHYIFKSDGTRAAEEKGLTSNQVLGEIYTGPKADLRPIHEMLMKAIDQFGEFEIVPKKGYVSLRRKKQFAMIGPATKTRVELGINIKGLPEDARLNPQPSGSMCNYIVKLTDPTEVDDQVLEWVKRAFENAG